MALHPAIRASGALAGFLAAAIVVVHFSADPSHQRNWRPEQAILPGVTLDDSIAHIRHVRNFAFDSATDFTTGYLDRRYRLDRLERVWMVISPLSREWRGPAHIFLSFEFSDSQYVSVSVEARREVGEEYSILKGALRRYELIYVIGEERDLIGLRAVAWDLPVYLYPIRSTPEQARALFVGLLTRARELEERPQFYNTFTNNCTTNILTAVNQVAVNPIPYGISILLPGYSDQLVYDRGLIDTTLSLDEARETFRINERARLAAGRDDFSARIRS